MKTFSADRVEEYLRCSEDREAADIIAHLQAENRRMRETLEGIQVVRNSGALKEFDGEPWLDRISAALEGKE